MTLKRTPEPEVMDGLEQAEAYANADFATVNAAFVDHLVECRPDFVGRLIDLGCGPADICLRLARCWPKAHIVGVDAAEAMLDWGRRALSQEPAALNSRVTLKRVFLPEAVDEPPFDAVISNSLLHQLHNPEVLWQATKAVAKPGAWVMLVDLRRPASSSDVDVLVEKYAQDEPEQLVEDFRASLHAAFTPDEVEAQLRSAGLDGLAVEVISDRHLRVTGHV